MTIISNVNEAANHYTIFKNRAINAEEIVMMSPFLTDDFVSFFEEMQFNRLQRFYLITTLKPRNRNQIKKVDSFSSLFNFFDAQYPNVEIIIRIDNDLHGKVYLFKENNIVTSAIITSANATNSGFRIKHEYGIEFFDNREQLEGLYQSIINNTLYMAISREQVDQIIFERDSYLNAHPQEEIDSCNLDLLALIVNNNIINNNEPVVNYWIKPIGDTANPIWRDHIMNPIEQVHFSTHPVGVNLNDILICYAVGSRKIMSVLQSNSLPRIIPENEGQRWPWFIETINLTPRYSLQWWNYELSYISLMREFLQENTDGFITNVGGRNLGALQFGRDRVSLNPAFARFLISKVQEINDLL